MDGKPILPAAAALELIAEGVSYLWPDWKLVAMHDFRLLKGIECAQSSQPLELVLQPVLGAAVEGIEVKAMLQSNRDGRTRFHYRGVAQLAHRLPVAVRHSAHIRGTQTLSVERAYAEWLFHGPRFQVIEAIEGLSEEGARVRVRSTSPSKWLLSCDPRSDRWLFDPGVVDAAAQVAILWARAFRDEVALPAGFGRVVRFSEQLPERMDLCFERTAVADPHLVRGDVYFSDSEGRVHLVVEDMECISSPALRRLGGPANATEHPDARTDADSAAESSSTADIETDSVD